MKLSLEIVIMMTQWWIATTNYEIELAKLRREERKMQSEAIENTVIVLQWKFEESNHLYFHFVY